MPKIAMNELTTYRWSFEDDVHHIKQAGYDGIGVWRQKLSDFGEERGVELLLDNGLDVSSLHWAGGFTGSDGRSYRESVLDTLEAIRLANELNTKALFIHSGSRAGHTLSHARRLFANALRETLPLAEEHGIRLVIEPMHWRCSSEWTCFADFSEVLELIESLESRYVAVALDCYHVLHDRTLLKRMAQLTERIAIVQLGDAAGEPTDEQDRRLLGEGILPLVEAVEALKNAGYDGFYEVELLGEDMELRDYQQILQHSKRAADALMNVYASTQ